MIPTLRMILLLRQIPLHRVFAGMKLKTKAINKHENTRLAAENWTNFGYDISKKGFAKTLKLALNFL